jgi:hypothetical protein
MTPPNRRPHKNTPERERQAACYVLDDGMSYLEAAKKAGIDGTEQVMKSAFAREEGRREVLRALDQLIQRALDEVVRGSKR